MLLSNKFRECLLQQQLIRDKTIAQQLKSGHLNGTRIFSDATMNLHQQNPYLTSGIIFLTILYFTIYIYCVRNSLLYVPIRKVLLDVL